MLRKGHWPSPLEKSERECRTFFAPFARFGDFVFPRFPRRRQKSRNLIHIRARREKIIANRPVGGKRASRAQDSPGQRSTSPGTWIFRGGKISRDIFLHGLLSLCFGTKRARLAPRAHTGNFREDRAKICGDHWRGFGEFSGVGFSAKGSRFRGFSRDFPDAEILIFTDFHTTGCTPVAARVNNRWKMMIQDGEIKRRNVPMWGGFCRGISLRREI